MVLDKLAIFKHFTQHMYVVRTIPRLTREIRTGKIFFEGCRSNLSIANINGWKT